MQTEIHQETAYKEMRSLCSLVKDLVNKEKFEEAFKIVYESMAKYPHNPEPHNLLGILLNKEGNNSLSMKHFRIAWILDPSYEPAEKNISISGKLYSTDKYIYDESDLNCEAPSKYTIQYDKKHIGHVIRKTKCKKNCSSL